MDNQLHIFKNKDFGEIRVVEVDSKPYAVGVDVARALEYSNPSKAVIDHCKGISKLGIPSFNQFGATVMQKTNVIPEGDIYRLIIKAADQSRNPEIKAKAEKFERWVFDEVLPSINKYGAYINDELLDELLKSRATAEQYLKMMRAERDKKEVLEEYLSNAAPKIRYHDVILQCENAIPITIIAKDYGMSAAKLNSLLNALGVQYKIRGTWVLYSKHDGFGYTDSYTFERGGFATVHTVWTQKGRKLIYNTLKKQGILPKIERRV